MDCLTKRPFYIIHYLYSIVNLYELDNALFLLYIHKGVFGG